MPLLKKKGAELIFSNYRPISNLQYLSKLVERVVVNQLCDHFDTSYPLPPCQSAYRVGHSTEMALVKIQSDILLAMDHQKVTQLVLIDLTAAFDTVSHPILLNIMEHMYGVSGAAHQWVTSYLDSRSQQVIVHGAVSEKFSLNKGVPQGSCLGPVLFTGYASPVFDVVSDHDADSHGYADDTQIYDSFSPLDCASHILNMQSCLDSVRAWMQDMCLKMNDAKTEFILFGSTQQLAKCSNTSISIGECNIEACNVVRNLGAFFDRCMTMEYHVQRKCQAAYAQLALISRIRVYLDDKTAEQLIHTLVHSHIDYCNSLLLGLPQCLIRKLQLVQNSAARVLCRVRKYDSIIPTLRQLHWLPVAYRIKFKVCCLTFRAVHGEGPAYIQDMMIRQNSGIRHSNGAITLRVPRTKTKWGDRAFIVSAPREWNMLSADVRLCDDFVSFKKKLKHHYFQLAYA